MPVWPRSQNESWTILCARWGLVFGNSPGVRQSEEGSDDGTKFRPISVVRLPMLIRSFR